MSQPSWAQVVNTPAYKALDFDAREKVRQSFFNDFVLPGAPTEFHDQIASAWDEKTNPLHGATGSGTPDDPYSFGDDEDRATAFLDEYPKQKWVRAPSGDVMSRNTHWYEDPAGAFKRGVAQTVEGFENIGPNDELDRTRQVLSNAEQGGHWQTIRGEKYFVPGETSQADVDAAKHDQFGALVELGKNRTLSQQAQAGVPRSYQSSQMQSDVSNASGFFDTAGALLKHPGAAMTTAAESTVSFVPALVVGAVTKNPALSAMVAGINSGGMEYASGVADYLQQQGIDMSDENQLAGLSREQISSALNYAKSRAAIIGTIDAVTGGLVSKNLIPAKMVRGFAAREAANVAAQTGVDMAAGAGGEYAAQEATGQKRDWNAILMEAIGEGLTKPAEVGAHIYDRASGNFDIENLPTHELADAATNHPDAGVRMASVMELAQRGEQIDLDKVQPLPGRQALEPIQQPATAGAASASAALDAARATAPAMPTPAPAAAAPTSQKPRVRLTPEQATGAQPVSPVLAAAANATHQPVGAIAPTAPTEAAPVPQPATAPAQAVVAGQQAATLEPAPASIPPAQAATAANPVAAPQSPPVSEAEVDSFLDHVVASGEQAGHTAPEPIQPAASLAAPPAPVMSAPSRAGVQQAEQTAVPMNTRAPLNLSVEASNPAQRASGTPATEMLREHVQRKIEADIADPNLPPFERGQAKKALVSLRRASITEVRLSGSDAARKGVLENVLGKRIVFLSATNPDGSSNEHMARLLSGNSGFFMPDADGTLYVNAASPGGVSPMAIIGHEFMHSLREHAPELYDEFAAFANKRTTTDPATLAKHRAQWDRTDAGVSGQLDHREEMHADFFGDMFNDESFWKELAKRDPGKFKRAMKSIIDFLSSLLHRAGLASEELFTDITAMREKAVDIFTRYSNEYVKATPEKTEQSRQQNKADDLRDLGLEMDPEGEMAEQMMWSPPRPPRPQSSANPPAPPVSPVSHRAQPAPTGPVGKVKSWAHKKAANFERTWLDQFRDLRVVQEWVEKTKGITLPAWAQPWRQENLRHGAFVDARDRAMTKFFEPVAKMLEANKYDRHEFEDFLWARHVRERDTYLRSKLDPNKPQPGPAALAGMSPDDADRYIASLDPKKLRVFTRAAAFMDGLRRHTLNVLVDSGQISDAHRQELLSQYRHYVPLRGLPDGSDPDLSNSGLGTGKGLSVSSSPLGKRAQGRVTPPSDILEEMKKDLERALVGAEKQKVLKQLVGLISLNPDKSLWEISPIVPHRKWVNGVLTVVDTQGELRDQVVYMHNGKPVKIELRDHNLKAALLGMNDPGKMLGVFRYMAKVTRVLSAVKTSLNPYFIFPNVVRDAQFALVGLSAEQGRRVMKTAAKNYPASFYALFKDQGSMKAVRSGGQMVRYAREFSAQGGKTGYTLANDINSQRKELNDLFVKHKRTEFKSLSLRDAHKAKVLAEGMIEHVNNYAENATRLAVYSALREHGVDAKTAAAYAKDATVNFNRKGSAAKYASVGYLFFNPAVQGTRRVWKLSKSRNAQVFFGGIMAASFAMTLFQMFEMGDDDDGENKYDKLVGDRTAQRAIVIALPGGENTITIPMAYGLNIFGYLGSILAKATYRGMTGKRIEGGKLAGDFLNTAISSMSPIDPGKGVQAAAPELMRIAMNMLNNTNDFGGKINYSLVDNASTPTNRPNFTLTDEKTAGFYKATARALNALTGGGDYDAGMVNPTGEHVKYAVEQALGGPAKVIAQSWALAEKVINGMDVRPGDIPVTNSFVRTNPVEKQQQPKYYENLEDFNNLTSRYKLVVDSGNDAEQQKMLTENPWLEGAELSASTKEGKQAQAGTFLQFARDNTKALKALREERDALYLDASLSSSERSAQILDAEKRMGELQKDFNRAMNAARAD